VDQEKCGKGQHCLLFPLAVSERSASQLSPVSWAREIGLPHSPDSRLSSSKSLHMSNAGQIQDESSEAGTLPCCVNYPIIDHLNDQTDSLGLLDPARYMFWMFMALNFFVDCKKSRSFFYPLLHPI